MLFSMGEADGTVAIESGQHSGQLSDMQHTYTPVGLKSVAVHEHGSHFLKPILSDLTDAEL